jgi:predicted  nucleic acid-binding Zn-ribbon protein
VRRYEFISGRRPGRAVVPAREGRCTGCNMMLPPQLFNELQLNTKILQCTNCQRVLYFETEEEQKRASAG